MPRIETSVKKMIEYRNTEGMTQEEFSKKLGVSRTHLALVERGKYKLSARLRTKLAEITNTEVSYWAPDNPQHLWDFEVLSISLDALISAGAITEDKLLPEEYREQILRLLEIEIEKKLKKEKERKNS